MIRPEIRAALRRWNEVIAAGAVVAFGAWLISLGGWVLMPIGVGLVVLAAGMVVLSLRRMRFAQSGEAPGVVELDEGQISYFSPDGGGFVSLRELTELRLLTRAGRRYWRLKQTDGQVLLVPVSAQGAERLFDAFAALPGMDSQALVAALQGRTGPAAGRVVVPLADQLGPVIWRRVARAALT